MKLNRRKSLKNTYGEMTTAAVAGVGFRPKMISGCSKVLSETRVK